MLLNRAPALPVCLQPAPAPLPVFLHTREKTGRYHGIGLEQLCIILSNYIGLLKNHCLPVSPEGKALCLLKTQFAKKPKNPV